MKIEKIKPIPKYMLERIKRLDKKENPNQNGYKRYFAYLTTNDGELVKVTVAVKNRYGKWYCKQCAVHGVHSEQCFVRDMGYSYFGGYYVGWHSEGLTKMPKWYENNEWRETQDKYYDPYAHIVNKEYIAKFPEYKYSAYEQYNGVDILQYLRRYEKYPQTEYLVKLGLSRLANSKQILEKAGKDKKFCKWLALNRVELSLMSEYYISTILQSYKTNKPLKEVQAYEIEKKKLCTERAFRPIRDMLKGDYNKYLSYVSKQGITNRLYLDYLNACNYLNLDMSEDKNRYPHNFQYWHDTRIDEYHTAKALKDREEKKKLYSKFKAVSDKYSALQYDKQNEYITVIAASPADLKREGSILNHCVGRMNYDQKFIREETLIFFIRLKENPKTPFVTAEYSIKQKRVLQCYAKGNSTPDKDVMQYVNEVWLPYANKTLKKLGA